MYSRSRGFIALIVFSALLGSSLASPLPPPILEYRDQPHHPTIPNALPRPPAPPRRDTDIYSAELVAYLDHMHTKSPILLEQLVDLLQVAWKAQMDFVAWYEIMPVPVSDTSKDGTKRSEGSGERLDMRDGLDGEDGVTERSLKWISPAERARWAEDCKWLRKVARKVTFGFELVANPLAMFPGSDGDRDICHILQE